MFVDEIKIYAKAGAGGDGVERWRREKYVPKGGPSGGDGGNGGNVYARAVRDITTLNRYKNNKEFYAQNGENGGERSKKGKNGGDIYIDLPVGSIITDERTDTKYQLLHEGETQLLLEGGMGGYGNERFKSSTNIRPTETTPGEKGEEAEFYVELLLIVDAGFVGLPNAGKSTLLNELTRAKARVGDYEFTTLDPNLGDLYGFVLADIPGLISGASEGKGLGYKFLKHTERTRMLIHCISLENNDLKEVYGAIREEMRKFDPALLDKPEMIVLTKKDVLENEGDIESSKKAFESSKEVYAVSILDEDSIKDLRDNLVRKLEELG